MQTIERSKADRLQMCEATLLWILYYHQGKGSAIGRPVRQALGIAPFESMTREQVEIARTVDQAVTAKYGKYIREDKPNSENQ